MSGKHVRVSVAAAVTGLLAVGACGQAGTPGTPTKVAAAAQQEEEPTPTVTLNAVEVPGLGVVLTDRNGMTLYRFNQDSADPSASTCGAGCVEKWPPVLGDAEDVVVAGMDKELVDSMPRVDGDRQITVAGWPLYRFAQDKEPGEAKGQGVGDTWFAVTADGRRAGGGGQAPTPAKIVGRQLPEFGAALTDQDGFTLYMFTNDSKNPSRSTCDGECAEVWPPVLVEGEEPRLVGVDPALVGEVVRDDGTRQVTVGGWPVYRYSKDTAPGQTNGHGVGGTWFVIEPAGCKSLAPVK